ncbi:MAG: YIP1 family protein [Bacilli bacterium]|nr:YIP1 family protein [Bacilli bacterium]
MKKTILFLVAMTVFVSLINLEVKARNLTESGIPYQTYTLGEYGAITPTQTAYIPVGIFGSNLGLKNPEDIHYHNSHFYLADSGNHRILVIDLNGEIVREYKHEEFSSPTGVFVNEEFLFVADKEARKVFRLELDSNLIVQTIEKPASPIFGVNNSFIPSKVAVGNNDNIYIVGEGSTSGIIQMNYAGEFIGYLGINTVEVSFRKKLYNFFVSDSNLAASRPSSPTNVALGFKGSILTTNNNVEETFKRLNISGVNTLGQNTVYPKVELSDIWMNDENYIYMVSASGEVFEYDAGGNLLFYFNTKDVSLKQTLGLTSQPSGLVTDDVGNLYILDKIYNNIQIYQRTVFVDLVHQAVTDYNNGRYLDSKPLWEEILRQNSSFALAHSALGAALTKEGKFNEALNEYYDAKDYDGYSNAFWEIRNLTIQSNLTLWVLLIIAAFVLYKVLKRVFRLLPVYDTYQEKKENFKNKKLISEFRLALGMVRRPLDIIYYVKRKNQGSYFSAFLILILYLLVSLINLYGMSFLFRDPTPGHVFSESFIILGIFLLFVFVNYLVSTFFDGEGSLRAVFIVSCYALIPAIVLTLPLTLLTYGLTYNEIFIYDLINYIIIGWTIVLLIVSIKEVHNYSFWETVFSIILIIFGIILIVILGLLIYSFIGQLFDFIISIIREASYRV